MEKVTFELDLGFGVCKEGRGPSFREHKWKVVKSGSVDMEKQTSQSSQGSRGRKGIRKARVMYGPDPSEAPTRGKTD